MAQLARPLPNQAVQRAPVRLHMMPPCFALQDPVSNTWHLEQKGVEFSQYMRNNGFHIIEIAGADQLVRAPQPGASHAFMGL